MNYEEITVEQAIEIFKYHNPIDDLDAKTFLDLNFQESVEFGLKKFYENSFTTDDVIFEVSKNLIKFQYKSISNKKDLDDIRIDMCKRGFLYRLEDYLVCIGVLDKEIVEIRRLDRRI